MFWNKSKYVDSYSEVSVNGKTIRVKGNNITIVNDKIIVDGKRVDKFNNKKLYDDINLDLDIFPDYGYMAQ